MANETTPLVSVPSKPLEDFPSGMVSGLFLDGADSKENILFETASSTLIDENEEEPPEYQITLGRQLARFLSNFSWYQPKMDNNAASLDKAWGYFEHMILPRHFLRQDKGGNLCKAEPGEKDEPTRLYGVFSTPEADLADFGVGVGIYFFTMRCLCFIMFVAGLLSIPNMLYYGSDAYNAAHEAISLLALKTSAVCTDTTWVACPTCTRKQWSRFPATYERYATTADGSLSFTLRNNCHVSATVAVGAYVSLLFVCFSIFALQKISKRHERFLDESSQTTIDYAIEVENPPADARQVDEWRTFFQQFGHVTTCTIALDNEELITALVARRALLMQLENLQPPGVERSRKDDTIQARIRTAQPVAWYWKLLGCMDAEAIQAKLAKMDEEILNDYAQRDYDVSNVFVVFETEQAQRKALEQMTIRGLDVWRQDTSALPENLLFRGEYVLSIRRPPEPSSVRWQDLDESPKTRVAQRVFADFMIGLAILGGSVLVTRVRYLYGAVYAALAVTAVNSIAPTVCRVFTELESHPNEGTKQASLYHKITVFLWINTSVITALITPFVDTLDSEDDSLIPAMMAIFVTEMFKAPVTQLMDVSGHLKRHILAPRAADQRRMNIYFQGAFWSLSERYTDMTNVLFLTFYYAFLFPAGYFFAAATLAVHYWVDKFCLLRNWAPVAQMDQAIAENSQIFFFSSAIAIYAVVSSYNLALFPYDNACESESVVPAEYVGNFRAVTGTGETVSVEIVEGDFSYFFCDQDMPRYSPPAFPAIPMNQPKGGEWMTEGQRFAQVFGWTSVSVVVFVIGILLNALWQVLSPLFFRVYEEQPAESHINFSDVLDIVTYIPQARVSGDPFPVLLCDVSKIDQELIDWQAEESYDAHNAFYDLGLNTKDVFSTVHHWPPPPTSKD